MSPTHYPKYNKTTWVLREKEKENLNSTLNPLSNVQQNDLVIKENPKAGLNPASNSNIHQNNLATWVIKEI